MIEIIGFKLLTKGRDIGSTLNIEANTMPDGGSFMAKSKMYCLICDKGNFEIHTGKNRGPVEVN